MFWDTQAGHNLAEIMTRFFRKQMNITQETTVVSNEEVGQFVEEEIKKGNLYVASIPYGTCDTLVIMEKS